MQQAGAGGTVKKTALPKSRRPPVKGQCPEGRAEQDRHRGSLICGQTGQKLLRAELTQETAKLRGLARLRPRPKREARFWGAVCLERLEQSGMMWIFEVLASSRGVGITDGGKEGEAASPSMKDGAAQGPVWLNPGRVGPGIVPRRISSSLGKTDV